MYADISIRIGLGAKKLPLSNIKQPFLYPHLQFSYPNGTRQIPASSLQTNFSLG